MRLKTYNRFCSNGSYTATQGAAYYPFGLAIDTLSYSLPTDVNTTPNPYLYNGKELQTQLGLLWLDYGARLYDAQVGRFWTQDRFAEKYLSMTMYQYGANNPIRYVDVNGDSLTITAQKWADKIKQKCYAEITSINKDMEKSSEKNKAKLQRKLDGFNATLSELSELEKSNQWYNVNETDGLKNNYSKDAGAIISYNFETNQVDIDFDTKYDLEIIAHDFKHAFQFEIGEIDLQKGGFAGILFFDKTDEETANQRGRLFGTSMTDPSGLPKGPRTIDPFYTSESINKVYKKNKANYHAYRINGKTYFYK